MPTGILSLSLAGIQTMLSNSLAFQTWTGAIAAEEAISAIYLIAPSASGEYPDSVSAPVWPFAVLNLGQTRRTLRGAGPLALFNQSATVHIYLEAQNDPAYINTSSDPAIIFLNAIGAILVDLEELSQGSSEGLQILSFDIGEPQRITASLIGNPGDYYAITIIATVGFS